VSADPRAAPPSAEGPALARLLHKYETLGELRRARARGEPIPEKAVFKALAAEMPGALYELDRLPLEDIDARRDALAEALRGGPIAPWMTAMAAYHALYRAALFVKARTRKRRAPGAEEAAALARSASRHASIDVGPAFVHAVACPEGGRIGPVVLAEVAARAGESASALREALFPTRRGFGPGDPGGGVSR
jgi:hypothetical protein